MDTPFTNFQITPSYSRGFKYSWEILGNFNDEGPWEFVIQEGPSPSGPWRTISPKILNSFAWKETERAPVNKSNVLYFRVVLETAEGSYLSPVIQPYGTLNRKEFLLAREIMRQAVLHSRGLAGVECEAYIASTFGPKCQHCVDPVTGSIRDSHCKHCYGTGFDPAYHGPYKLWIDFSEDTNHNTSNEQIGTVEKKTHQARAIGNPHLKQGDVIIAPSTDKRYYISSAAMTSEIRQIPVIQTLILEEAPHTDKIYDL